MAQCCAISNTALISTARQTNYDARAVIKQRMYYTNVVRRFNWTVKLDYEQAIFAPGVSDIEII